MRWFSLLVIAFSVSALIGGYLSGTASLSELIPASSASRVATANTSNTKPPAMRTLRGEQVTQTDETADDAFSDDAVDTVPQAEARIDAVAHVELVVVSMGHSVAIEAPFTQLPLTMTCVIDPHGQAAHDIADMAANAGKAVYIQLDPDAAPRDVTAIAATFPNARGIAARFAPGSRLDATMKPVMMAANASHLALFDEYGAQPKAMHFARQLGVAYAGRSITVDNHLGAAYVDFMVEQAVRIARGQRISVMARPIPSTLAAFQNLAYRAASAGIAAEGLPTQASGNWAE